jgi:hypothetical protein
LKLGTVIMIMIMLATILATSLAGPPTKPSAYVVQVTQQTSTKQGQIQPYPRGVSNQVLKVQLGPPSASYTYLQASSQGRACMHGSCARSIYLV